MMYVSLILSIVVAVFAHAGVTAHCPSSSARWCDTHAIAQACGVAEQCDRFVWKVRNDDDDDDRVNFTLYYETLCPDCRQFISTQVSNAFQSVLSIVNISFVPFGNAKELYRPETKLYQFYCQHGADECYGNQIHTCAINVYPNTTQHFPYINCTESTDGDVETVAMQCAEKTRLDFNKIKSCVQSRAGNQLQHLYAVQTASLQPPHQYVPWITINDEHTEEMQAQAEKDLVGLICTSYKGSNVPAQCTQYL